MKIENKYKYIVYIHTNKLNGKMYVGITSKSPKIRWGNGKRYREDGYFGRAIKKYGWINFDHEIIATKLTEKEAKNFEIVLINKLNTTNPTYGYNISKGGDGTLGIKRPKLSIRNLKDSIKIEQYDLSGNYLNSYPSLREMQRQTGFDRTSISKVCSGKAYYAYNSIWIYSNSTERLKELIEYHIYNKMSIDKPVLQYDLDGKYLNKYKNLIDASKATGIYERRIANYCKDNYYYKTPSEFIWKYDESSNMGDFLFDKREVVVEE
jgi:hypothetical protein